MSTTVKGPLILNTASLDSSSCGVEVGASESASFFLSSSNPISWVAVKEFTFQIKLP